MTVDLWTGREARALRQALRLSVRGFAEYLGVSVRTVSRWEQYGVHRVPRSEHQAMLDTALRRGSPEETERFGAATRAKTRPGSGHAGSPDLPAGDLPPSAPSSTDPVRWEYPSTPEAARTAVVAVTKLWLHLALERKTFDPPPWDDPTTRDAGWRWHFDLSDADASGNGHRQVGLSDVARLREVAASFVTLDRQFGGGHVHPHLLMFLHRDVTPLLSGRYSDSVGRLLFGVAAEVTCQLGFSAYDAGQHGVAKWAFIHALRMAKTSGDLQLGMHILANMCTQAVGLGRTQEAVQLGRAAAHAASDRTHPVVRARIHATEATAHAMVGDAASFTKSIVASEKAVARVGTDGTPSPGWAGYFTHAHWAGSTIRGLRDLGRSQEALAYEAMALDLADASVRTRALHSALLATVHAAAGSVDRACELANDALDSAEGVSSERVAVRLVALSRQLEPHESVPEVVALVERLETQGAGRDGPE